MTPVLTPEQTRVLAVLDVVREAIATGQEMQLQIDNSGIWTPAPVETVWSLRAKEDCVFRIKPKPEIVRLRVGVARAGLDRTSVLVVLSAESEGHWNNNNSFLGWVGPWQEVDVSTLTKDEVA